MTFNNALECSECRHLNCGAEERENVRNVSAKAKRNYVWLLPRGFGTLVAEAKAALVAKPWWLKRK